MAVADRGPRPLQQVFGATLRASRSGRDRGRGGDASQGNGLGGRSGPARRTRCRVRRGVQRLGLLAGDQSDRAGSGQSGTAAARAELPVSAGRWQQLSVGDAAKLGNRLSSQCAERQWRRFLCRVAAGCALSLRLDGRARAAQREEVGWFARAAGDVPDGDAGKRPLRQLGALQLRPGQPVAADAHRVQRRTGHHDHQCQRPRQFGQRRNPDLRLRLWLSGRTVDSDPARRQPLDLRPDADGACQPAESGRVGQL